MSPLALFPLLMLALLTIIHQNGHFADASCCCCCKPCCCGCTCVGPCQCCNPPLLIKLPRTCPCCCKCCCCCCKPCCCCCPCCCCGGGHGRRKRAAFAAIRAGKLAPPTPMAKPCSCSLKCVPCPEAIPEKPIEKAETKSRARRMTFITTLLLR